jgi:nitroreductase
MGIRDNGTIRAILGRRSVRRFEERPVDPEVVNVLIECASAAPSAANSRPCHFVVVTERGKLDAIAGGHPYAKMLASAPLAVVVCGEPDKSDFAARYWEEDCSAAMENLLVAAHALGLGGVWIGVRHQPGQEPRIREILGIPDRIAVLGVAVIGYGRESREPHSGIPDGTLHLEGW